jgi:hypothetical protein
VKEGVGLVVHFPLEGHGHGHGHGVFILATSFKEK